MREGRAWRAKKQTIGSARHEVGHADRGEIGGLGEEALGLGIGGEPGFGGGAQEGADADGELIGQAVREDVARECLARHDVLGVDCFTDYYARSNKEENLAGLRAGPRFGFEQLDLATADLAPIVAGADAIFHQAAQAGVRASWGKTFETYTSCNVLATQRLLEAAKNAGTVERFVYASSSSVYGDTTDLPMRETSRPRPFSPYGVTKLAAEHLTWLYWKNYGLPTVSLRYFTVYGPRQRPDMAFHRFIKAVLTGQPIRLYGDGDQTRDFTYVDDIVDVNLSAAVAETQGRVYNVGGGSRTSVNEVIEIIGRLVGTSMTSSL